MSPDSKYLTLEEVAELLSVDYQLVYRLVRNKELPAIRVGRIYRVAQSDLDGYLERSRTTGPAQGGTCSACGTHYQSSESLSQECATCGAPICFDCWTRRGVRHCIEHAASAGGEK